MRKEFLFEKNHRFCSKVDSAPDPGAKPTDLLPRVSENFCFLSEIDQEVVNEKDRVRSEMSPFLILLQQ